MKARELKFWENVHPPKRVTCHMSRVTCQMSHFFYIYMYIYIYIFFLYKVVELIGGGSVINGATPSSFPNYILHICHKYASKYIWIQINKNKLWVPLALLPACGGQCGMFYGISQLYLNGRATCCAARSVRQAVFHVHFSVCSVQCADCSVQCAVYRLQCAVCSVQTAVCTVQCAVCSVKYAVCCVKYAIYDV